MFGFRLWRIPIVVHVSHVLISGLVAFMFSRVPVLGPEGWPAPLLESPDLATRLSGNIWAVLAWMLIVSGSVLAHELGHALTARAMGYPVSIHLAGLGGRTLAVAERPMRWSQDLAYSVSGPFAGLALGVCCGLAVLAWEAAGTPPAPVRYILRGAAFANIVWMVVNMLPISTLDGGRATAAVLTRVLGRAGFLVAQLVSVALTGAGLALALVRKDIFLVVLTGVLLWRTWLLIAAYRRGELPQGEGAHPLLLEVQQLHAALEAGTVEEDEAHRRLAAMVSGAAPAGVKQRAHVALGWVAVKRGHGREALRHFAQGGPASVPRKAMAAALSLAGDDARALPLWGEAARYGDDPIVLHELAGTLVRLGKEAQARALPGVRMALAYRAAERVFALRGNRTDAAHMAEEAFRAEPSDAAAYEAACAWGRAGDADSVMRLLTLAAQNGYSDGAAARADPDLSLVHPTPQFQLWLEGLERAA